MPQTPIKRPLSQYPGSFTPPSRLGRGPFDPVRWGPLGGKKGCPAPGKKRGKKRPKNPSSAPWAERQFFLFLKMIPFLRLAAYFRLPLRPPPPKRAVELVGWGRNGWGGAGPGIALKGETERGFVFPRPLPPPFFKILFLPHPYFPPLNSSPPASPGLPLWGLRFSFPSWGRFAPFCGIAPRRGVFGGGRRPLPGAPLFPLFAMGWAPSQTPWIGVYDPGVPPPRKGLGSWPGEIFVGHLPLSGGFFPLIPLVVLFFFPRAPTVCPSPSSKKWAGKNVGFPPPPPPTPRGPRGGCWGPFRPFFPGGLHRAHGGPWCWPISRTRPAPGGPGLQGPRAQMGGPGDLDGVRF